MKKQLRTFALILAMILAFGLLAGCGGKGSAGDGKTLTVGTLQTANSFDPLSSENDVTHFLVYDPILRLDGETMEIKPGLAEAWNWVDDTHLELTIREGVKFSNGETLTPEDVLYTIWRATYVNDQYTKDCSLTRIDLDACTIDGNKLTLVYKEVCANALSHLTMRFACVMNKKYAESCTEQDFWDKPVGTGPYTLVENVSGSHSSYTRRDDYWGAKPEAKEIRINYYGEASTMYVDMETGAIDIAINVATNDAERAMKGETEGVKYKLVSTRDLIFVSLPEYMEVYDDIRVRQAVAYGLDAEAITKALYGDLAEVADSTVIKGLKYYESQGIYEYNPEKSKQLLAEAGYKDGDISLRMIAPLTPTNSKFGEAVQSYMRDIGIETSVEILDFPIAIPMLMNNECELALASLNGGMCDPADIYSQHSENSTNGSTKSNDATINGYITAGRSTVDDARRQEAYSAAQKWDHENFRWLPICYPQSCLVYSDKLNDVPVCGYLSPYLAEVTFVK